MNSVTKAPSLNQVEAGQVKYLKLVNRDGKQILVARPYVNGQWMPQQTFELEAISEAVAYIQKCLSKRNRFGSGRHPKNSIPIRTLAYYFEKFIQSNTHFAEPTLANFENAFLILGRVVTSEEEGTSKTVTKVRVSVSKFAEILREAKDIETTLIGQSAIKKSIIVKEFLRKRTEEVMEDQFIPLRNLTLHHLNFQVLRDAIHTGTDKLSARNKIVKMLGALYEYILEEHPEAAPILAHWHIKKLRQKFRYTRLKPIDFYSETEREKIRNFESELPKCKKAVKSTYGLLILLMNLGPRISELLALDRADYEQMIASGSDRIRIDKTLRRLRGSAFVVAKQTKNKCIRDCKVNDTAMRWLKFFYDNPIDPTSSFLMQPLMKCKRKHLTYKCARLSLINLYKKIGVRKLPTHEAGRKTMINMFVDAAVEAGNSLDKALTTVGANVGHANSEVTKKNYARAKSMDPKEEHDIFKNMK